MEESTSSSLTGRIEDNQNTNAGHGGDTNIETAFDWSVIGKSQLLGCPHTESKQFCEKLAGWLAGFGKHGNTFREN